jgi:cytochrome c-type biogenesis protein CcmF
MTLVISALQILFTTSIPVFNAVAGTNMAPPAEVVSYYNRWQLPIAVLILLLGTIAFELRFKKSNPAPVLRWIIQITLLAVVLTLAVGYAMGIGYWSYLLLVFAACFALTGNIHQLYRRRNKFLRQGGLTAHLGFALMMLGVLVSSSRREVVSLNLNNTPLGPNFSPAQARENVLIYENQNQSIAGYAVRYLGDSVVEPNRYYKLRFEQSDSRGQIRFSRTLYPNAQINPKMGLIASPATMHFWDHDLYMHVTQVPDPNSLQTTSQKYNEPVLHYLDARGDTLMLKEYLLVFRGLRTPLDSAWSAQSSGAEVAVGAPVSVRSVDTTLELMPVYVIRSGVEFRYPDQSPEPGIRLQLQSIDPAKQQVALAVQTTPPPPRPYVVLKMLKFPWINAVWYGSFLVVAGLSMSIVHRNRQYRNERRAD